MGFMCTYLKTDIHYGRHVRIDDRFEGIRPTKSSETDTSTKHPYGTPPGLSAKKTA